MPQIAEEQFGFVSGKGTTNAILTLRNINWEDSQTKSKTPLQIYQNTKR